MTFPWHPYDDGNRVSSPYGGSSEGGPPPPELFTPGEFNTNPAPTNKSRRLIFIGVGIFGAIILVIVGMLTVFAAPQQPVTAIRQSTATPTAPLAVSTCATDTAGCVAATITPMPGAIATATVLPGMPTPTPVVVWVYPTATSRAQPTATSVPHATPTNTPTSVPTATATAIPTPIEVDDAVSGTGSDQFNYSGTGWVQQSGLPGNFYDTSASYSNTTGDSVTVTFTGIKIQIVCDPNTDQGIMGIYLDGVFQQNVDLYSNASPRNFQQVVYASGQLVKGAHTLTMTVTGTANPSSSNTYDLVDAVFITP